MIESGTILAAAGILVLVMVTYLITRRPVRVPVIVRTTKYVNGINPGESVPWLTR